MNANTWTRALPIAVLTLALGCMPGGKRSPTPAAAAGLESSESDPAGRAVADAVSALTPALTYYPKGFTAEQVYKVNDSNVSTEAQVMAILGPPTDRSSVRVYHNRLGECHEWDLTWLKEPGRVLIKTTFFNDFKTTVLYAEPADRSSMRSRNPAR